MSRQAPLSRWILLVLTHELSHDSGCDGSGICGNDGRDEEVGIFTLKTLFFF